MIHDMETRTLEMLAVAMSEEYSVSVICNGQSAGTSFSEKTGKATITIPSIPVADRHYRALLRGYVDHEVGHVRFTDRARMDSELLRAPHISGSLKNVAQIFEDLYVERGMGESFPGCRRNLRAFGTLIYLEHDSAVLPRPPAPLNAPALLNALNMKSLRPTELPYPLWAAITRYMLFRTRSDVLPKFQSRLPLFREPLDILTPGLADRLEPVLARVREEGTGTAANLRLAREAIETALGYFEELAATATTEQCPFAFSPAMLDVLKWILRNGGSGQDSVDIARAAELMVDELVRDIDPRLLENHISIHDTVGSDIWKSRLLPLTEEEQKETLQASAMMEAQMQALLQSFELNRSGPARTGRLNTNALHKLLTCRNDIFFRHIDRRAVNTEIVLCIDMSGSMHFENKALLASKALYSLARSLSKIRGLAFNITGFFDNHVVDILRSGSRVTPRMHIVPDGGTLCGSALKFAMQTFTSAPESRKIVIMITDGDANDGDDFEKAIAKARKAGIEFLGVGILDDHIAQYLPADECCIITELRQLASEILRMLRKKLGIEN